MSNSPWTAEQKARQSARQSKIWQEKVAKDPDAHPLARARRLRNLTGKELAALAGCTSSAISAIESGTAVSRYLKERIARVIALPETELFT
jgi:DNA-binding XRE family transcriptional regulator